MLSVLLGCLSITLACLIALLLVVTRRARIEVMALMSAGRRNPIIDMFVSFWLLAAMMGVGGVSRIVGAISPSDANLIVGQSSVATLCLMLVGSLIRDCVRLSR